MNRVPIINDNFHSYLISLRTLWSDWAVYFQYQRLTGSIEALRRQRVWLRERDHSWNYKCKIIYKLMNYKLDVYHWVSLSLMDQFASVRMIKDHREHSALRPRLSEFAMKHIQDNSELQPYCPFKLYLNKIKMLLVVLFLSSFYCSLI